MIENCKFCPLHIPDAELSEIPETNIFVAEHDVLKNDGQVLYAKLQKIGVKSQLETIQGGLHAQIIFSEQFAGEKIGSYFPRTTKFASEYIESLRSFLQ